ncbi:MULTISPECIES: hypothetical protein [Ramlibacter]|uniref:Flagellar protein FlgN n=1 Tax=Ramlibacter aquaticus TaxID=2780094 RepID=A0ABR9SAD4_9BURK|nr:MULTISPECIES: hypothetical protein [Ramlibacter]MBE7939179.1 hypothetical protein [Ramlibacter aquaticus]
MTLDWRVAVAAVDAALDRQEAALLNGLADDLPRLSRELQAAVGALARSGRPGAEARPALEQLAQRAQAQQGIVARRGAQVEQALAAIGQALPALATRHAQRTYGASAFAGA